MTPRRQLLDCLTSMAKDGQEAVHEKWLSQCSQVTEEMKVYTRPYITPLSTEDPQGVRHVGTGSFLCWNGATTLLTCEHVVSEGPLNFSFFGSDNVFPISRAFIEEKSLDAAIVQVSDTLWKVCEHSAKIVPATQVAARHQPSRAEELFFFHGFAGENSYYGFETLISNASAYVTQQSADAIYDERIFELLWEPQKTILTEPTNELVRKLMKFADPGGFSGSLVWNTRYLEVTSSGGHWTPECAVVSGLLKRWDTQTKTLLVLRVEHLRHWIEAISI